jgi:uncharacterized SAM-binding protein YcdF (DUF218 family)
MILLAAFFTKNEIKRKRRLVIAFFLTFLLSNNFLINQCFLAYESAGNQNFDKPYDVGLVLGGFSKKDTFLKRAVFFEANDRLMQALALYSEGKIKKIMISSGSAQVLHQELKEADAVKDYLKTIGIPDSNIIIENQSRNTLENINYSKTILDSLYQSPRILVISSAWHLPRVKLCLKGKLNADVFACNQIGDPTEDYSAYQLIIPNANALSHSELLIKEWVGYVFYWLKN